VCRSRRPAWRLVASTPQGGLSSLPCRVDRISLPSVFAPDEQRAKCPVPAAPLPGRVSSIGGRPYRPVCTTLDLAPHSARPLTDSRSRWPAGSSSLLFWNPYDNRPAAPLVDQVAMFATHVFSRSCASPTISVLHVDDKQSCVRPGSRAGPWCLPARRIRRSRPRYASLRTLFRSGPTTAADPPEGGAPKIGAGRTWTRRRPHTRISVSLSPCVFWSVSLARMTAGVAADVAAFRTWSFPYAPSGCRSWNSARPPIRSRPWPANELLPGVHRDGPLIAELPVRAAAHAPERGSSRS